MPECIVILGFNNLDNGNPYDSKIVIVFCENAISIILPFVAFAIYMKNLIIE